MRISDLVIRHPRLLDGPVPACPGWTARHVVAHLVGLCRDLVDGRIEGWATESWTAAQVERFGAFCNTDLLTTWEQAAAQLDGVAPFGSVPAAAFAFGDAAVHEADLRPVLEPGTRVPAHAVTDALAAGVARWRSVLSAAAVPALHLDVPGVRAWWLGDRDDSRAVSVEAPAYDIFRALYGRRSYEQAAAWRWSGPSAPYIGAGLPFPFRWAESALVD